VGCARPDARQCLAQVGLFDRVFHRELQRVLVVISPLRTTPHLPRVIILALRSASRERLAAIFIRAIDFTNMPDTACIAQ
jgi:hypothetical protein